MLTGAEVVSAGNAPKTVLACKHAEGGRWKQHEQRQVLPKLRCNQPTLVFRFVWDGLICEALLFYGVVRKRRRGRKCETFQDLVSGAEHVFPRSGRCNATRVGHIAALEIILGRRSREVPDTFGVPHAMVL